MWYDLGSGEGLTEGCEALMTWLQDQAKAMDIPLERVILGGFSQGGAMTLEVGLRLPLAGLICMSGYLHPQLKLPELPAPPPTLVIHGDWDPVVPIAAAQSVVQALQEVNATFTFKSLPMAHEINPEAVQAVQEFLRGLCLKNT
jgi:phospholipase/carboxylesterase